MRLDNFLVQNGYFNSRTKAKQAIERGEIFICGENVLKSAYEIEENFFDNPINEIKRVCDNSFVSLGGFKLHKALLDFGVSVDDFTCVDVGASTGGFTDCLLQNGAKKVYAVDLNDYLLDISLKNDCRVVSIIKNARELVRGDFDCDKINLLVCDLSFISATQVMPIFSSLVQEGDCVILLIKPQFELNEKRKFKNGIIREGKVRENVCRKIFEAAIDNGFSPIELTTAPISNDKNIEYLMLMKKGSYKTFDLNNYNF